MNEIKLQAVGDISLQTTSNNHPFKGIEKVFKDKDLLFGNLETALSIDGKKSKKAVILYSSPEKIIYLKEIDFDVLNIANNHILDCGVEGFNKTLHELKKNNLKFIGANNDKSKTNHLILQRKGIKFGFLGYTQGYFRNPKGLFINKIEERKIFADIKSIQRKCDFIIVSLHWGTEYAFYPSPKQINFAHKLIDEGVTLILGHHPHVIQGIEEYKNGLIAYSLGNFQFRPRTSKNKTNDSVILNAEFDKEGITKYEVLPVEIDKDFIPKLAENQKKDDILKFISDVSEVINNKKVTNKWWFEEIAQDYLSDNMNSYVIRIKRYGILPLIECAIWLLTPFCIRCYAGNLRRKLKGSDRRGK